jgi:hypothetical protein
MHMKDGTVLLAALTKEEKLANEWRPQLQNAKTERVARLQASKRRKIARTKADKLASDPGGQAGYGGGWWSSANGRWIRMA